MAHRSNQAVASQDQAAPQPPDEPTPPRRLLVGWATALAALGVSTVLLGVGLWFVRFSVAEFMLDAALAERGAEADFEVINLGLNGATLEGVRFGSETSPDAFIPSIEARWGWRGIVPELRSLRVMGPRLRVKMDTGGRVSAGSLDRLGGGPPGRERPSLARIELEIVDGQAIIEAPFGPLTATFHSSGTLGRDFAAAARIAPTSRAAGAYAVQNSAADLAAISRGDAIAFRLSVQADALAWSGARAEAGAIRILGRAPLDLSRYEADVSWRVASLVMESVSARTLSGAIGIEAIAQENSVEPATWQSQARLSAAELTLAGNTTLRARVSAAANGDGSRGEGRWSVTGERFEGLALISENPSADGAFRFELRGDEAATGTARITLAQARLDGQAQETLRDAFPDLAQAPVGPTFARAERALGTAADRFDLVIALTFTANENSTQINVASPAQARAATGATLTFAPLRQDGPALALKWPGPTLSGAVAIELSGGGAPNASLLLDTLVWRPDEAFDADGTLTLTNWTAANASIATNELGVSITVAPSGEGRIDLRGPARITGPLGDGEVRNLVATLDLGVIWNEGWRVVSERGCLPVELGGIDAAGLSFAHGAFALCPAGSALIAADAHNNLSGGFTIQGLALNGRMSGPEGQPARLSAANILGRFSGRSGHMTLALEAGAPRLAIDMGAERTMAIALQRLTANAHIAESWRVDGAFTAGSLSDPSLPGSVSSIAGSWSAEPEDDKPVIRVSAGEALLTANRPATDDDRPLFHAVRLIQANAIMRDGEINADGAIELEAGRRQLARFTASHNIDAGRGVARVTADELMFGRNLQPYDITEQARGLVDNVSGPVGLAAEIAWAREAITSNGHVRLNGISLATSTIPVVHDVRGDIYFDDLFELTTPPGQEVRIGLLNPGVAVTNGRVGFRLLPEERVSIEHAEFDFASGTLAMAPTTIRLGAEETRFELRLRDVDAADLLATLNVPDLAATGRVEGAFPLLLTRRTAFIENGVLRAQPGGGTIAYTGNAGQDAIGPARLAFDALRSFRYDDLVLTLDGDLSGDVVSSIEFSGENTGTAVDLGPIAPVPGLGAVSVRGVPFDFNVSITAPFGRLARTAASIVDPGSVLNRGEIGEPLADDEEEPVDQTPPGTR